MSAKRWPRFLMVLVIVAAIGGAVVHVRHGTEAAAPVPGMVRQTEIRIAPETTGRLASLTVGPGQHVRKGDVLAVLDNPELAASVGEAKAAAASARADRDRIYSGVRAEEVAIAAQNVRTAETNLLLAQQQNARVTALSAKDFASREQLDESNASLAKAQATLDLKQARHAAANAGPTAEERALADARVALAEATVADLQARLDKTTLTAPTDGFIGILVGEPGEIISPGKPVMTMEAEGERWFTFTLREDTLRGMTVGGRVSLTADDGRLIDARVTELRPLGEFATWRAARAVGDHDLNSFRLRLDPLGLNEGLQPGMTVWLPRQP
jgi:multidrug resistance efflux pump